MESEVKKEERIPISTHIEKELLELLDEDIKKPYSNTRSRAEWFNWYLRKHFRKKLSVNSASAKN